MHMHDSRNSLLLWPLIWYDAGNYYVENMLSMTVSYSVASMATLWWHTQYNTTQHSAHRQPVALNSFSPKKKKKNFVQSIVHAVRFRKTIRQTVSQSEFVWPKMTDWPHAIHTHTHTQLNVFVICLRSCYFSKGGNWSKMKRININMLSNGSSTWIEICISLHRYI